MEFLVSPHWGPEKLETGRVEDLIDVFEDRILGYMLFPAQELIKISPHFAQAGVALSTAYFETIASYELGKDLSSNRATFCWGACKVLRADEREGIPQLAELLWTDVRNGYFHDGIFRPRVFFRHGTKYPFILDFKRDEQGTVDFSRCNSVVIDPQEFLMAIATHFHDYLRRIRDPNETEARANFERTFRFETELDRGPVEVNWHPDTLPTGT